MRLNRFIGKFNIVPGIIKITDPELLNQTRNVLRLRIGEQAILSDGNANEGIAEIMEFGKGQVVFNIKEVYQNQSERKYDIVLYCSVLKKENFEFVVQKATEVGVRRIVPIITERTVKLNLRADRLEKIMKEAAEQSGRAVIPELSGIMEFKGALEAAKDGDINILFDKSGESIGSHLRHNKTNTGIWIGPEGGWTDAELEMAKRSGFDVVSLGPLVLRAETAAIIGSFLSTICLEDSPK